MTLLQQEASESCSKLRREVDDWKTAASGSIEKLVHGWGATRQLVEDAEKKTATLAQVALLHGNRLKTARAEKDRAITAIRRLNHLQMFAHATSIDSLPALFHDETRAGEAGVSWEMLLVLSRSCVDQTILSLFLQVNNESSNAGDREESPEDCAGGSECHA